MGANQHTSPLVGIEKPWADAYQAGLRDEIRTALAPHASRTRVRSILSWLADGAPYDGASSGSISYWRRVLAAAGAPPRGPAPAGYGGPTYSGVAQAA